MTLYTHAGSLPRHQYVWIEPGAMGAHDWLPAVWFGLTSYPGRAWGCHVLLECGAVYRNVPPTNNVLLQERSFTINIEWPTYLRRQDTVWSCED